jgi:hypothetical protein
MTPKWGPPPPPARGEDDECISSKELHTDEGNNRAIHEEPALH